MEFDNSNENFMLYGESYSEAEVLEARSIRDLPDGEEKQKLIAAFQEKTGKTFPEVEPIEFCFNPDTAYLSSLDIDRSVSWLMQHPRESRSHFPLQ